MSILICPCDGEDDNGSVTPCNRGAVPGGNARAQQKYNSTKRPQSSKKRPRLTYDDQRDTLVRRHGAVDENLNLHGAPKAHIQAYVENR